MILTALRSSSGVSAPKSSVSTFASEMKLVFTLWLWLRATATPWRSSASRSVMLVTFPRTRFFIVAQLALELLRFAAAVVPVERRTRPMPFSSNSTLQFSEPGCL